MTQWKAVSGGESNFIENLYLETDEDAHSQIISADYKEDYYR